MEKYEESRYVKRTQKDYTLSFKLQIVQEIERGKLSTTEARINPKTCGAIKIKHKLDQS